MTNCRGQNLIIMDSPDCFIGKVTWTYHTVDMSRRLRSRCVSHSVEAILAFLCPRYEYAECFDLLRREKHGSQKQFRRKNLEYNRMFITYDCEFKTSWATCCGFSWCTPGILYGSCDLAFSRCSAGLSRESYNLQLLPQGTVRCRQKKVFPVCTICTETSGPHRPGWLTKFPRL